MDDGSCLAFFEVPGSPFDFKRQDSLDLHIALGVGPETFDAMIAAAGSRYARRPAPWSTGGYRDYGAAAEVLSRRAEATSLAPRFRSMVVYCAACGSTQPGKGQQPASERDQRFESHFIPRRVGREQHARLVGSWEGKAIHAIGPYRIRDPPAKISVEVRASSHSASQPDCTLPPPSEADPGLGAHHEYRDEELSKITPTDWESGEPRLP
jgi:hypothetical protein